MYIDKNVKFHRSKTNFVNMTKEFNGFISSSIQNKFCIFIKRIIGDKNSHRG